MEFPPGGIVNLNNNSSSSNGCVGSDIEEVVQWDCDLCLKKTFTMAFTIPVLYCQYDAPKLEEQQKLLNHFINEPAEEYFRMGSKQAKAFNELKIVCNLVGKWKHQESRSETLGTSLTI
jgi:hypothetical protein